LAYALRGAKVPFFFFLVFACCYALFFFLSIQDAPLCLPKSIFVPLTLFFLWCWLPLAGRAPVDHHLYAFSRLLCYAFFTLAIEREADKEGTHFAWVVVGCACLESLFIIVASFRSTAPAGVLAGNPGYSALLIAAGFSFLVLTPFETQSWDKKLWRSASLLVLGWGLWVCRSRGAFLGLFCGLAIVLLLQRRARFVLLGLAAALILAITLPDRLPTYAKMPLASTEETSGRLVIWKSGIEALRENWLIGFGLDNFEAAYLRGQQPAPGVLRFAKSTRFAHNDFLQFAVEAGIPSAVFLIWALTLIIFRARPSPGSSATEAWAYSTLILYTVFSLFNFSLYLPLDGLLLAGAVGILFSRLRAKDSGVDVLRFRKTLWAAGALLGGFLGLFAASDIAERFGHLDMAIKIMPIRSDLWYERAAHRLESSTEWLNSPVETAYLIHDLKMALLWNPGDPFIWSRWARVLVQLPPLDKAQIERGFKEAITLAPKHVPFTMEEGFYFLQVGDLVRADADFRAAAFLEPLAPLPRFGQALVMMKKGEKTGAMGLLNAAIALQEKYAKDWWPSEYDRFMFSTDPNQMREMVRQLESKQAPK